MTLQAAMMRDVDTAKNEGAMVRIRVNVIANSNACHEGMVKGGR